MIIQNLLHTKTPHILHLDLVENKINENANLVIFTCMHLQKYNENETKLLTKTITSINHKYDAYKHIIISDFNLDASGITDKTDVQTVLDLKDSYDAIKRSLEFSHQINPVGDKLEPITQGGSKPRYPVVTPHISSPSLNTSMLLQQTGGFSLSPLAINFMQLTCFMYAIKIIRWTYYKEYNKKDKSNTTFYRKMFVDYSLNLMMLIFLHATRQTDLLYTFLFDEIISIMLLMKTGNEDVLLYPYYVGIMPFSISKMVR